MILRLLGVLAIKGSFLLQGHGVVRGRGVLLLLLVTLGGQIRCQAHVHVHVIHLEALRLIAAQKNTDTASAS